MVNELLRFSREQGLLEPGDRVVCCVSGGADSIALLWAMYLLKDRLGLELSAAHFNHHLRGEESNRDAAFVARFCKDYQIPLYMGEGNVVPGPKGLEAAAREARYAFFDTLPGKLLTAHTADDNAETVLLNMIRGTGLRGLGAIAPKRGRILRPMLSVTRKQVLAFLEEYHLSWVEDSSNGGDDFLRNRIRHHILPLMRQENPSLPENLSRMALGLRLDAQVLEEMTPKDPTVSQLRQLPKALRCRALATILENAGVREPDASHIHLAEQLVFSENPSARGNFPGGVILERRYDQLLPGTVSRNLEPQELKPGVHIRLPQGILTCSQGTEAVSAKDRFCVVPQGTVVLRSRQSGDRIRLNGGSVTLKKLFVDRKIPASQRSQIPVIADDLGVLGVVGIGANLDRLGSEGFLFTIEKIEI